MSEPTVGEQELALLRYVSDRPGVSVGQVADGFGHDRGLARSTVLTMMERLRKKGYLNRRLVAGVYRYRARTSSAELLRGLVSRFVEKSLGGSVAPFVAYLNETRNVSDEELKELEELVSKLQATRQKGGER
ncbi:MAG: BlaI/MecI/CopY family transcriptional regulator [Acidobacteriota bacterium]